MSIGGTMRINVITGHTTFTTIGTSGVQISNAKIVGSSAEGARERCIWKLIQIRLELDSRI